MNNSMLSRRDLLAGLTLGAVAIPLTAAAQNPSAPATPQPEAGKKGSQRLPVERLQKFEALGYGMFIHFGMSTFVEAELPSGQDAATVYAPDKLDVDQWISVARDSGMKYAILTTKHVAGHCLWPSKQTDYTVANSGNKTDVVEKFVKACGERGVLPGFYYCSWDNHTRLGSSTPSDKRDKLEAYTTSLYQTYQTAQVEELLTQYGRIAEMWIDIPGVLGRGYRTFLYNHVAALQPDTTIMMNSGISTGKEYRVDYAWPSDIIAIERNLPPGEGHDKWRKIEGKDYYMPGEVCDPIGKEWFYVEGDVPRPDEALAKIYDGCHAGGVNLLLDVPPDKHGLIPDASVQALQRLRKHATL